MVENRETFISHLYLATGKSNFQTPKGQKSEENEPPSRYQKAAWLRAWTREEDEHLTITTQERAVLSQLCV